MGKEMRECIAKDISHAKLDVAFVEYISSLPSMEVLSDDLQLENSKKTNDLKEIYEKYKAKLDSLEKKEKSIMKLYVSDNIDFDEYAKMAKLTKSDLTKTKEELEKIELQLEEQEETDISKNDVIADITENWLLLTNSEKMSFVSSFIKSIVVCNQEQKDTHYGKIKIESVEFFKK